MLRKCIALYNWESTGGGSKHHIISASTVIKEPGSYQVSPWHAGCAGFALSLALGWLQSNVSRVKQLSRHDKIQRKEETVFIFLGSPFKRENLLSVSADIVSYPNGQHWVTRPSQTSPARETADHAQTSQTSDSQLFKPTDRVLQQRIHVYVGSFMSI